MPTDDPAASCERCGTTEMMGTATIDGRDVRICAACMFRHETDALAATEKSDSD